VDSSGHDLPLRSSLSSQDIAGQYGAEGTDGDTPRKDGHHALMATLSSLSVPTRYSPLVSVRARVKCMAGASDTSLPHSRQQPPIPEYSPTPTPPLSQNAPLQQQQPYQPTTPPLAVTSPLGEVVNILNEALALERDIFMRPIEIQSISTLSLSLELASPVCSCNLLPAYSRCVRTQCPTTVGRSTRSTCR
jgi:hypothetical protein